MRRKSIESFIRRRNSGSSLTSSLTDGGHPEDLPTHSTGSPTNNLTLRNSPLSLGSKDGFHTSRTEDEDSSILSNHDRKTTASFTRIRTRIRTGDSFFSVLDVIPEQIRVGSSAPTTIISPIPLLSSPEEYEKEPEPEQQQQDQHQQLPPRQPQTQEKEGHDELTPVIHPICALQEKKTSFDLEFTTWEDTGSIYHRESQEEDPYDSYEYDEFDEEEDHGKKSGFSIEDDIRFSMISNILFLLGGASYLIVSTMDLLMLRNTQSSTDNDWEINMFVYNFFCIFGPVMYILNAVYDYICALLIKQSHIYTSFLGRMDAQWDMLYAVFFGVGAIIDTCTASLDIFIQHYGGSSDDYAVFFYLGDIASTQFYLVSGIFFLFAVDFSCSHLVKVLVLFGDTLFFSGSCLDAVNAILSDPELFAVQEFALARASVVSNTFWTTNAILYLNADFIIWCHEVQPLKKLQERFFSSSISKNKDEKQGGQQMLESDSNHHELELTVMDGSFA